MQSITGQRRNGLSTSFARRHGISTDGNPLDVVTAVLDYATTAAQERAFLHEANQNLAEALNIEKADRQGMGGR
jgi:hypothetical protein